MPLTPSHFLFGFFLGGFSFQVFNFWAILFASFLPDIEPLSLVLIKRCYQCPHHGFFHSIFGAIFGSLILAFLILIFKKPLNNISLKFLKIKMSFSFFNLYFSAFLGWFLHILFDSFSHWDVFLFWPSKIQPTLIGKETYWPLSIFLIILGIFGIFILISRIYDSRKGD